MEIKRGEIMRKGRVIVILCLSLILCFMCLTTNTFSWFNRIDEIGKTSGKTLVYKDKKLKQSSGKNYEVTTYKQDGSGQYPKEPTGNTIGSKDAPLTLEPGERQCFKTQIKSNNETTQNVSLYLSGVTSSDYTNTYVGVNNPMRTYKNVGTLESKTINNNGRKNVYVGIFSSSQNFDLNKFKLHWSNSDGTKNGDVDIKEDLHSEEYQIINDYCRVYHAEVPWDATGVKFKLNDQYHGGDIDINYHNFVCLRLNNDGSYREFTGQKVDNVTPAGIESFYSKASVNVNGTIDLTAAGNNLVYKSSDESIAKVETDSNGKVVYVRGVSEGDAEITVTSTGTVHDNDKEPDTLTFTCKVHVGPENGKLSEIPVVTNMEISKYETDQNILTVYWYIKNTSSEKSINVSVDKINVTL